MRSDCKGRNTSTGNPLEHFTEKMIDEDNVVTKNKAQGGIFKAWRY